MEDTRTKNSMKNIYISILGQAVMLLLGFFSRKVFIDNLGSEYLGVNGLLGNIISMMSLVEGGIGVSIVYNLYKPLAEKDEEKVIALVQLYKKLYLIIAGVIIVISIGIYPFLTILSKGVEEVKYIWLVYIIFVAKNCVSYLNAHKWSLINADQKGYVLARYIIIFDLITTILKIVILTMTQNYILYLLVEFTIFFIQNLWNGKIVSKRYPYINSKRKYEVEKNIKNNLIQNVKAMCLHNIGGWAVFGTDNILISIFIDIKTVGIYSNYTMIINQVHSILGSFIGGIGASIGNLIATEGEEKNYKIFKLVNMISFFIYSISAIALFNIIDLFITWWLGDGLLIGRLTLIIVLVNFYIKGMRGSISTFKTKGGIFVQDKYMPLLEAVINLGSSIILVKYLGLAGIFIGTTISTLAITIWTQPLLVYRNIFKKPLRNYFQNYLLNIILTLIGGAIAYFICNLIGSTGIFSIAVRGVISVVIPVVLYSMMFYKTDEFKEILNVILTYINVIRVKLLGNVKV